MFSIFLHLSKYDVYNFFSACLAKYYVFIKNIIDFPKFCVYISTHIHFLFTKIRLHLRKVVIILSTLYKIAVTCKGSALFSTFADCDTCIIYEKENNNWKARKQFTIQITAKTNPETFRNEIRTIIAKLDDCKIIVSQSLTGLAYHIFDRMGFYIFETAELAPDTFDQILHDIDKNTQELTTQEMPTKPMKTDEGIYFLDFIQLQQVHPEISSKRALQPFLQSTPFIKLDILCSHLPPWLESPDYKNRYDIFKKKRNNAMLISISPKSCIK